ncbi:MAG: tetratricopeptide repeat protein [Anaerolineales bacterium]|jgi:putative thioredoxin
MSSEFIVEVTEADFQYEVLAFSNTKPVVVDFWAEWCQPCHMLTPILEKLTREARGAFRLAKVNADENPNLTMQFNVNGLPTVKGFYKSQVVAEFVGAQTEMKVREFLRKLAPSASDLALEKGQSLIKLEDWKTAGDVFQKVLKTSPDDSTALLGLAKSHIAQGNPDKALVILQAFPASKELNAAENLLPLAQAMAGLEKQHEGNPEDELRAAFDRSVHLVGKGNLLAAADGLLDILRRDKDYLDGNAKHTMVAVLELMDPDKEETRQYRSELASVLF